MSYNEKQIQIMETAEQLFAISGFGGTSVRQIADKAGVNLAMISYYFGSKEKLIEALVDYRMSHVRLTLESLLKDESLTPLQKMNLLVTEYVDRFVQRHHFYKIMVTEHMFDKNSEITVMLLKMKKRNTEVLQEIISEGQRKKIFRKDVDIVMLMSVMVGTANHAFVNREFYKAHHKLEHLSEQEFITLLKQRVTEEIKAIFKAQLIYEG